MNSPSLPIYVTRKNADGVTGTWYIGAMPVLIAMLLAQIAAVLWLGIAVVAAVVLIVNSIAGLF